MRAASLCVFAVLLPAVALAQPCTTDSRRVVDAAYQQILGRAAGADGIAPARELASGDRSVRDLIRDLALSPEHQRRFLSPGAPNAQARAVTNLYTHILGRQPDPEGLNAHVNALASQGVDAVVDSLVNSPEYQNAFGFDTVPGSQIRFCGAGETTSSVGGNRFRGMDRNSNGVIERQEWNGSAQSFSNHDWNRDGVLSGDEVRAGARRQPRDAAEDDFNPMEPWSWSSTDFTQMDRNRDNRIAASEWFYDAATFRRTDRDRNGFLSMDEFTASVDDDRGDRFEDLDVNGNGRVDRGEWHGSVDAFQWLDRNRDNVLSRSEVVGEAATGFDNFTSLDIDNNRSITFNEWRWSRRSFDQVDTNRDGVVSRQEFAASRTPLTAVPR